MSLATARAAAVDRGLPLWQYLRPDGVQPTLPMPMLNVINGGAHADNGIDFQEYLIVPVGGLTFAHALQISVETYHALRTRASRSRLPHRRRRRGRIRPHPELQPRGARPSPRSDRRAGYRPGDDVAIALDPAVSALRRERRSTTSSAPKAEPTRRIEAVDYWEDVVNDYPIFSLEDAMAEDDWDGWKLLTDRLGDRVQLIGDDIFVTNHQSLQRGIDTGVANSILIKLNQIGTLTETLETIAIARANDYLCVISHRSGETDDAFISDLAVATGVGQIKAGAPARGERVAKYNQLLRIEEELGPGAADFPIVMYPGRTLPEPSTEATESNADADGKQSAEPMCDWSTPSLGR